MINAPEKDVAISGRSAPHCSPIIYISAFLWVLVCAIGVAAFITETRPQWAPLSTASYPNQNGLPSFFVNDGSGALVHTGGVQTLTPMRMANGWFGPSLDFDWEMITEVLYTLPDNTTENGKVIGYVYYDDINFHGASFRCCVGLSSTPIVALLTDSIVVLRTLSQCTSPPKRR